jgi:hypothetical protein
VNYKDQNTFEKRHFMTGALSILSCEQICFKCSLSTGNIWSQSTPVRAAKGNKYTCSTCKSWNNVIGQEIRGAIPPLTQYAFIVWCSVKERPISAEDCFIRLRQNTAQLWPTRLSEKPIILMGCGSLIFQRSHPFEVKICFFFPWLHSPA